MTASPHVHRIDRVVAALRASRALTDDDANWLATGLEVLLRGGDIAEQLFGPKQTPQSRNLSTQLVFQRRDELLRSAAALLSGMNPSQQARELHTELARYAATGWRNDSQHDECPARAGTVRAACWAVLKIRDYVPSESSIRKILATRAPYSLPAKSRLIDS